MIKRVLLMVAFCSITSAAQAQQPQVPSLSDIVPVIERQRNQALANHAVAQGRASELTRENDALKAALAERDRKIADLQNVIADLQKAAEKPPQNLAE